MTSRIAQWTLDVQDVGRMAEFWSQVLGYGVGVPGVVDQGVVYSQVTGWDAVPLGDVLAGGSAVPVFVENGAKTVGQAEMWFGAGRGSRHAERQAPSPAGPRGAERGQRTTRTSGAPQDAPDVECCV